MRRYRLITRSERGTVLKGVRPPGFGSLRSTCPINSVAAWFS